MSQSQTSETPPFGGFAPGEAQAICAAGQVQLCQAGEVVFRRHEVGTSMFLIEEGEVELKFADGVACKCLSQGGVFGELAFVTGRHRRTATARALTPCQLRVIDEAAFESLLADQPRLLVRLLRHTCGYLLESENRLIASLRQKNRELESTLDYLRRTREEVDYQELLANTDELTGLYNRRCLDRQLAKFIARAHNTETGLALILIDVDDFKTINDTHGHAAGDRVLRSIGLVISECVRASDLPCRFGGDEFAIVLTRIEPEQAVQRAEAIFTRIRSLVPVPTKPAIEFSISIGGAMLQSDEAATGIFDRADQQLYRAKHQGRNRVCWHPSGVAQAAVTSVS